MRGFRTTLHTFENSLWFNMIANLALITAASCYKFLPNNQSHIPTHINSHKYNVEIERIPHHTLIVYSNLYCSGSLVRSRIVVTAASCFEKRKKNEPIIVKIGSRFITGLGQVLEVLELKIHEYFAHGTQRNNDIAILLLKNHVVFSEAAKKIVLVEPDMALRSGISLDVSGWGSSKLQPKYVNVLLWSKMVVMDREECKQIYHDLITSSNFCVRYQAERQLSDNGGPAEYDHLLVGIVSFGASKTEEPFVAVLTNVSYFNRWIVLNSQRFMRKYCVDPKDGSTSTEVENNLISNFITN